MVEESVKKPVSPQQQLEDVGHAMRNWANNLQNIDEGKESDGHTQSGVLQKIGELQDVTLNPDQQTTIEEITEMSLATGINPQRIKELAIKFGISNDSQTDENS